MCGRGELPARLPACHAHPEVGWVDPVHILPHRLARPVGQAGLVDCISQHALGDAVALRHTVGWVWRWGLGCGFGGGVW